LTDDKTMIMERVIQLVSNLPSNSKLRVELTNTFLGELWYSLEHPPSLYVGDKYQYRQADGSYNVRRVFGYRDLDPVTTNRWAEHHVPATRRRWYSVRTLCERQRTASRSPARP
jgi:hypothetical protein